MDEDRVKHAIAVARKMIQIAKDMGLSENEINDCFIIGYNHDIGYEFGDNSNHNEIGGKISKENGYKYLEEVYYHGKINTSFSSQYLDILNMADMQINNYGEDVGFEERLKDIKNRYGEDSLTYKNAGTLVENIIKKY